MNKEERGFYKTWEELTDLSASVNALARKAQIREVHTDIVNAFDNVIMELNEIESMFIEIENGDYDNDDDGDKKVFLLDKDTFSLQEVNHLTEDKLEQMVGSGNYFEDDLVKIDANGYRTIEEAIKSLYDNDVNMDDLAENYHIKAYRIS